MCKDVIVGDGTSAAVAANPCTAIDSATIRGGVRLARKERVMRTVIIGVTAAMLGVVSVLSNAQGSRELQQPKPDAADLAGFSIAVGRTSEGVALTCESGCAWTTLTFGCAEKKACTSTVNAIGMTADEKTAARSGSFAFTVQGTRDGVTLACERGCAWKTLTVGCGEKKTCASSVTEYGMAKETK